MILCGHQVRQEPDLFPLTRDSVALAYFSAPRRGARVLDLGAGQGYLGILLQDWAACTVDGVERDPAAAAVAADNYRICGCAGEVRAGDWRGQPAGAYDLCVSNPPYFPAGSGPAGSHPSARRAEEDGGASLCAAAARALKNGGRLCLCLPPEYLTDWLCALRGAGLEPKRLRPVCRRAGHGPDLLLLEGKKGGRPGLRWLPPLLWETRTGAPTAEQKRIYQGPCPAPKEHP